MATYLLWSLPTIVLSVALGLLVGWVVWGSRRTSPGARAVADAALQESLLTYERELSDRDQMIAILREELADEAAETGRLRRRLQEETLAPRSMPGEAVGQPDAGRGDDTAPVAVNGRDDTAPTGVAGRDETVADRRVAASPVPPARDEAPASNPMFRRPVR